MLFKLFISHYSSSSLQTFNVFISCTHLIIYQGITDHNIIIVTQNFQINFQSIVSKNILNNFLLAVLYFCEFKPFLNFIFPLSVWPRHQPLYIIPNSLSEKSFIVFLTVLFDYLIYKVIYYFLHLFFFFKYDPNVSCNFSQRT